MATFIRGDAVENATSYELFERSGDTYTFIATASRINFEVSSLIATPGDHILVVKAKANGYADSDYSNEVIYRAEEVFTDITSLFDFTMYPRTVLNRGSDGTAVNFQTSSFFDSAAADVSAYAGKTIKIMIPQYTNSSGTQSMNATAAVTLNGDTPTFVSELKLWDAYTETKQGVLMEYTIVLPSNIRYLYTSIFNDNSISQGIGNTGFYCKVVE